MRHKIIALASLLLVHSLAFADSTVPYVGASLGVNQDNLRLKDPTNVNTNFNVTGWTGGFFAGLGWAIDEKLYLAGEGFANEMSARSDTKVINTGSGTTSAMMRMRYNFGGSVLPGIFIGRSSLVYARLGVIRTRIEQHQTVVPAGSTSNIEKSTATGGQLGIGIQGSVAQSFAIRGEYDYTGYHTFSSFGNKVTPHDNQITVGLLYLFC